MKLRNEMCAIDLSPIFEYGRLLTKWQCKMCSTLSRLARAGPLKPADRCQYSSKQRIVFSCGRTRVCSWSL